MYLFFTYQNFLFKYFIFFHFISLQSNNFFSLAFILFKFSQPKTNTEKGMSWYRITLGLYLHYIYLASERQRAVPVSGGWPPNPSSSYVGLQV